MRNINQEFIDACKRGNLNQATVLLEEGADINFGLNSMFTIPPLYDAIQRSDIIMVGFLLTNGADASFISSQKTGALSNIQTKDLDRSKEMIKLLINNKAALNAIIQSEPILYHFIKHLSSPSITQDKKNTNRRNYRSSY